MWYTDTYTRIVFSVLEWKNDQKANKQQHCFSWNSMGKTYNFSNNTLCVFVCSWTSFLFAAIIFAFKPINQPQSPPHPYLLMILFTATVFLLIFSSIGDFINAFESSSFISLFDISCVCVCAYGNRVSFKVESKNQMKKIQTHEMRYTNEMEPPKLFPTQLCECFLAC